MIYTVKNENETKNIAKDLSKKCKTGDVICLFGTLGMGKSVFAREFIRSASDNPNLDVPSPTFTMLQTYDCKEYVVYHFDLYRIKDPSEAWELGLEEALYDGVSLIEWSENLASMLPRKRIDVIISQESNQDPCERTITIKGM